jgi:hypothetical protein
LANVATEVLTLDQFHHCMGYISTEVAQKLIEKGFMTGVRLKTMPSGEPHFCESYVYAKATHKPVARLEKANVPRNLVEKFIVTYRDQPQLLQRQASIITSHLQMTRLI